MSEIVVLGAGMVGISTALELQSRGHDVTVVDRTAPGRETSFGNAGIVQAEAAEPYAMPRDLPGLLNMALGRTNDLTWSLRAVLEQAPALWHYFRSSAPQQHMAISRWHAQLIAPATQDHARLITASGADNLITRDGFSVVYRDAGALDRDARDLDRLMQKYGIQSHVLGSAELAVEEPAITGPTAGAIHWSDSWSCADPGGLVEHYAALFEQRGGRVRIGDATSLRRDGAAWRVASEDGDIQGEAAVIALGPWAPEILRRFGYRVRMVMKRGYHRHYSAPRSVRRPFLDVANGVVASSMRRGLRVASGAALVRRDAPADTRQLDRGASGLAEIIELGPRIDEAQWFGTRPFMPDMLPVVGQAPRHAGMWLNFGHGHQGFTLGPTTARLLADAMDGTSGELHARIAPIGRPAVFS